MSVIFFLEHQPFFVQQFFPPLMLFSAATDCLSLSSEAFFVQPSLRALSYNPRNFSEGFSLFATSNGQKQTETAVTRTHYQTV